MKASSVREISRLLRASQSGDHPLVGHIIPINQRIFTSELRSMKIGSFFAIQLDPGSIDRELGHPKFETHIKIRKYLWHPDGFIMELPYRKLYNNHVMISAVYDLANRCWKMASYRPGTDRWTSYNKRFDYWAFSNTLGDLKCRKYRTFKELLLDAIKYYARWE